MKLEKQVTSVELSNKLKKLGMTAPGLFFRDWTGAKEDEIEQNPESLYNLDNVNCYNVAELGEVLWQAKKDKLADIAFADLYPYRGVDEGRWQGMTNFTWHHADTEADARAKMLIYLLENELLVN